MLDFSGSQRYYKKQNYKQLPFSKLTIPGGKILVLSRQEKLCSTVLFKVNKKYIKKKSQSILRIC